MTIMSIHFVRKPMGTFFEDITWPSELLLCPAIEFLEIFDFIGIHRKGMSGP
jgi:hypothetical protein